MVPVRVIFEGIGASVEWEENTKTITGKLNNDTVVMQINSKTVSINSNDSDMDASPLIINGRTYAPARYVAESFGYSVGWDSEIK